MKRDQKLRDRYGYGGTGVGKRGTISADLPEKSLWNPQKCAMI